MNREQIRNYLQNRDAETANGWIEITPERLPENNLPVFARSESMGFVAVRINGVWLECKLCYLDERGWCYDAIDELPTIPTHFRHLPTLEVA